MICKEVNAENVSKSLYITRALFLKPCTLYYKKAVQLEPDIEYHVTSSEHHDHEGEGG